MKARQLTEFGHQDRRRQLVNAAQGAQGEVQIGVGAVGGGHEQLPLEFAALVLGDGAHRGLGGVRESGGGEGRSFVHPFEGPVPALGTATLGLEFGRQAPDLDAVVVPIGGGGLAAGVSAAIKQLRPECQVFGVEPRGADTILVMEDGRIVEQGSHTELLDHNGVYFRLYNSQFAGAAVEIT